MEQFSSKGLWLGYKVHKRPKDDIDSEHEEDCQGDDMKINFFAKGNPIGRSIRRDIAVSSVHTSHIFDPIHGYIGFSDNMQRLIDTPHVQRLRRVKQMGASYYVFPGASHNRFEHSIGVMHLANKMMNHLKNHQPNLYITDDEIFAVSAAGLLHGMCNFILMSTNCFSFIHRPWTRSILSRI